MRRAAAGLAVALFATGCSYDFRNPAEALGMGQALGRVVADRGAGAEPLAGAQIAVENSPNLDQITRDTGRFTLLSLPIGRHRVLFRKGTQFAGERFVDIAAGDDGKPEGVNLGDIRLRASVTIQGTLTLPASFSAASYGRLVFDVTDEVSGQPAALASSSSGVNTYSWALRGLSVGEHRLRFVVSGDTWDPALLATQRRTFGAPTLTLTIPETSEGQLLTMAAVSLEPQAVATAAPGSYRFRLQAIGPGAAAAAAASTIEVHDAVSYDPKTLGTASLVDTLHPDSAGWVQAEALPGLYVVRVIPPAPTYTPGGYTPGQEVFWEAPAPVRLLVRSGALTEIGTLYIVDSLTGSGAAHICFADSECGGGTCVNGTCQGGSTPYTPVVPLTMPYCMYGLESGCTNYFYLGQPCGAGGLGQCRMDCRGVAAGASGTYTCFPDATTLRCTPDGVVILDSGSTTTTQFCP